MALSTHSKEVYIANSILYGMDGVATVDVYGPLGDLDVCNNVFVSLAGITEPDAYVYD